MITATARPVERKAKIDFDPLTQWGIGLCTAGLLIAALSLSLTTSITTPSAPSPVRLLIDLSILAGMTLFALGVLGIVVGTKSWKSYFEAGLRDVILQHRYLKTLSPEGLRDHLIEILKEEHRDAEVGREGGLLRYCLDHIHKYLSHPYQENVAVRISIDSPGESMLRVTESLDYLCRQAGGKFQDRIVWQAASREVINVEDFRIELRWPKAPHSAARKVEIRLDDVDRERLPDGGCRFAYGLEDMDVVDGLRVRMDATYLVHASSFHNWSVSEPIHNLDLEISFPSDLDLQFLPYLLCHEAGEFRQDRGLACAQYESWVLPGSGFAWKLVPAYLPDEVQIGSHGTPLPTLEDVVADSAD
jgi:hypothetical protein